ncbi:hypothetical protein G443_000474 [Actinoalloteichus cyanogriseus DSM 43889]|uniref:Uncharacterized protein n=1 Tax=Actinoalloteichus caeruleus DSM 43889 TaxID=1120930 RepID=A0ABT1JCJ6_ACTCY|nr:hypothetical protein [Actinoalloteichus caeruleus DSM 43889]
MSTGECGNAIEVGFERVIGFGNHFRDRKTSWPRTPRGRRPDPTGVR